METECPKCGADKNPDFPTCFKCSREECDELDAWVRLLSVSQMGEPF